MANKPHHLVVVGGGFAGLTAIKALNATQLRVTLIDRRKHHLFQPLLYQVTTADLATPDLAARGGSFPWRMARNKFKQGQAVKQQ